MLLVLTDNGWNEVLNELIRKLYGYEEIARIIQIEKTVLENKLREVLGNKKEEPTKEEKKEVSKESSGTSSSLNRPSEADTKKGD